METRKPLMFGLMALHLRSRSAGRSAKSRQRHPQCRQPQEAIEARAPERTLGASLATADGSQGDPCRARCFVQGVKPPGASVPSASQPPKRLGSARGLLSGEQVFATHLERQKHAPAPSSSSAFSMQGSSDLVFEQKAIRGSPLGEPFPRAPLPAPFNGRRASGGRCPVFGWPS